jgi:CheY-like chemotaxis protein
MSHAPDAPSAPKHRVLVIDDNVDAADTLSTLLELLGHDVRTAHDGRTGVRLAAEFCPRLILLDIGMPVMDGYAVAAEIRATATGTGAVLAALTGWGQDHDRKKTRAAGFDHHIVKPADPDELQKILAGL